MKLPETCFVHPAPPAFRGRQSLVAPYREGLFAALDRLGIRLLFVTARDAPPPLDPGLRRWSVLEGGALGPYRKGVSAGLLREAMRGRYDVWLASILNWWPTHAGFPVVKGRGKPFVLWSEDWWWPEVRGGSALRLYDTRILRKADAIVAAGSRARDFAVQAGADEECVFVAPNSTEHLGRRPCDAEQVEDMRRSLAGSDPGAVCLFLNRLVPYKGLDVLLRAWRNVERAYPDVHLAVVGEGPERDASVALVADLDLHRVRFHPWVSHDQIHLVYRACDLYVHPARYVERQRVKAEAWGFTVNEAMSTAVPVVATTAVASAYDLIEQGTTGFMVRAGDATSLTEALLDALDNRSRLKQMGSAAQRNLEEGFTPDKQAAVFERAVRFAAS